MLPPRIVRRLVVAPLVALAGVATIALAPLLLVIAFVLDLFDRHGWRTTRLVALGVVFSIYELVGLVALVGLWVLSGFGLVINTRPVQAIHVSLARWWLNGIALATQRLLAVRIDYVPQVRATGPVLVFSRHGGPGDSVFLARTLLVDFGRQPRIVAKRELQWAPFMDTLCNRLPNHFVDRNPKDRQSELLSIERLASGIDDQGALVLFPEGGNFTIGRRERAISRLETQGKQDQVSWAQRMPNLMAPKPGGAMAAMRGAPEAEVVFVAHSGLEDLTSLSDIWDALPLERTLKAHYWRTTPEERPSEPERVVAWLYRWWSQIDRWIEENRPADVAPAPRF